jgi:HlyD family secretion protein
MRWIILAGLVLAGCGGPAKEEEAVKPLVTVKAAKAEVAEVQNSVTAPATIYPREQANISARITAPIRELKARKGDMVQAGQTLALLENRDLLAQRAEVRAAVADAQASLDKVTAGTLPTDVERARGQVETAQAAYEQAMKIYEKRKQLYEQGAIPNRELLISQTEMTTTKTNLDVAKKSLDLLVNQSRERDIQIAQSRLAQARARLENLEAQITFTELKSPFRGSITEQFGYPGDMARPDTPIFTVVDMSVAQARAQVPETEAHELRAGVACRFIPTDHPESATPGRVSMVNRALDPARRTVETWCEIANPPASLRAGLFGQVRFLIGTSTSSIVVPIAAVQFNEGTRTGFVMTVDDKKIAHKRDVECGITFEGKVQVLKGLKEGETVITEAGYGLPDGAQVQFSGDAGK